MPSRTRKPKIKREVKELSLLFEISQILDQSVDLRDVVNPVLKAMSKHMGMVRGTLTLLNKENGELFIETAYGLSQSQKERGRYKLGEGVTGKVVETGRPAVVPKIDEDPMFLNKTGARKKLRRKDISFICTPIQLGNEIYGALSADRLFSEDVSPQEDLRLLSIISSMIAQAVRFRQSIFEERQRLMEENKRLHQQLRDRFQPSNIIGSSHCMQNVYDSIAKVAGRDVNVLIRGETGVGKELVAQAVHYNSPRADKPFIKVNCAALPENIIESELFGHEKGAFTGAINTRKGRFELADTGTIFLDEIGDISSSVQIKLLRILQENEFERVGGTETRTVNTRVIAATNRDLEKLIETNTFREDLYYRLNIFPIYVPPLRERGSDILMLADFFVAKYNRKHGKNIKRISTTTMERLANYYWPGNVRELESCIERSVIISNDEVIHLHHLPPTIQSAESSGTKLDGTLQTALDNVEYDLIVEALKLSRGNMAKAARQLGVTERIMGLRVEKHRIDYKHFR